MSRVRFPACLGAAIAALVLSPGCSCGGDDAARSFVGTGGGGGEGDSGGGGSGAAGGEGGEGGEGGGDPRPRTSINAADMVSAGNTARSPSYRMVFTLGQPTQNQGKTTSPSYRLQGGLVGANGSLP